MKSPEWGLTEIANKLQLNKSTVSRLVTDLVAEGFLQKDQKKYSLGFSLLSMSGVITSHLEIHRESKDILKKLVADLGETAHIVVLEGKEITYVHKIECRNPVVYYHRLVRRTQVSCTSAGKVLLAFKSNDLINSLIEAGLPRMGPNSVTDSNQLKAQLIQIKEQGYSICINEMHEDVVSIAASVRDYTGEVVAAVSVVGTSERIHHQKINQFVETIIEAANEVSIRLGYIPLAFKKEVH